MCMPACCKKTPPNSAPMAAILSGTAGSCVLRPRGWAQIRKWMREAGLRTWQDGVGNVHGRLDGRARDAPALLLGSHYDTVTDAGKYDGALGIVVAIAAVKALILQARAASA